jgi:hypothetical protein
MLPGFRRIIDGLRVTSPPSRISRPITFRLRTQMPIAAGLGRKVKLAGSRPANVIGTAIMLTRTAIRAGTKDAPAAEVGKDPAAAKGRKGEVAPARSLASEQRVEIAGHRAAKRWGGLLVRLRFHSRPCSNDINDVGVPRYGWRKHRCSHRDL